MIFMAPKTIIENNVLEVPKEILEKFKGKKIVEWNLNDDEVVLKFSSISPKCKKLEKELFELEQEMFDGKTVRMDMSELADFMGLDNEP